MIHILDEIINAICLFEIIQEEQSAYFEADRDVDTKRIESRIKEARELKKNYITILN